MLGRFSRATIHFCHTHIPSGGVVFRVCSIAAGTIELLEHSIPSIPGSYNSLTFTTIRKLGLFTALCKNY
jgi:hypothetical protein